jgi:tetratricopeptide (TPR) repeat protein
MSYRPFAASPRPRERSPAKVTETNKLRLERCLRQVEDHPDSAAAHFNLGLAYTQKGQVDRAEQAYRRALEIDPDLVEAWVNLGGVLLLKWDFQGSMHANREALKRNGNLVQAHYNSGQACLYLGDAEGVVRCTRRVIELEPGHASGHYFLAVGLLATGAVEEAREAAARAQALGHSPAPEFLRALSLAEQKLEHKGNSNIVTNIGADAPKDPNRRE